MKKKQYKNMQINKHILVGGVLLISVLYFTSLFFKLRINTSAQQTITLEPWQQTASFPGDGSPYGSFVRNGTYYVNTTHVFNNDQARKETYFGKPDANGNITTWTKAWDWHGGTHGFGSVTVKWSDTEEKVFMTRNGHIGEYEFNADGTMAGNDYKFWGNENDRSQAFEGRFWVWDSMVYAPLTTGKFVYHLGGFSCPGKNCTNSCTHPNCSGANVNYKNNGNIYYQQVPFVHWDQSEQYYRFKYTGKNHPDWTEGENNDAAPGKSVFYAPNGGSDYGFIYVTKNRALSLHSVKINNDGSLGDWRRERDLLPDDDSTQQGGDRGDIFVIGDTFFAARGDKVYSAPLDPATGVVGAWDDSVPDLPEDQVRVMGWGKDNEGTTWGVIGDYVYLTGQLKVYYAKINRSGTANPTATPANTTPTIVPTAVPTQQAGVCPDISANQYETHETDSTSAENGMEAAVHPHKNINVYGYELVSTGRKALFDQSGLPQDVKAPQFSTVFSTTTPAVVNLYKIYDWDSNQGKHLASDEVSMIGIGSNPGDVIQVPDAKFNLDTAKDEYGGPLAIVMYADDKSITLKYTLQDDIVSHYTTYIDNICVDPNLLSTYNNARAGEKWPNTTISKRLPVVKGRQYIGTAKANEVRLAVRNSGDVVDPRWKNGWWRDTPGPIGGGGATGTPFPTSYCGTVTKPDLTAADMPVTYPGTITVKWSKPTGVSKYVLKIDDMTSPWDDTCTSSNLGDVCENNVSSSLTSHQFNAEEGHSYHVILKSEDICGQSSAVSEQILTASPPISNTTCRIQGYRAVVGPIDQSTMKTPEGYFVNSADPNKSESIWVSDTIKAATISVTGGTPNASYQHNPYSFVMQAGLTYTVSIASVPGYNIYAQSTTEQNPANQCSAFSYTNGQSVSVNCMPNQISKVWWYFVPNGVPTIALTPTSAPPTPTPTTIPEITYCKEVQVPSQDKTTQFDVILLPDGYDVTEEALAIQDAKTAITESFNKTNLPSNIKSKLNFWVNTNLTHSYDVKPGCGDGVAYKVPCWDRDKAKEVQRLCEGDGYAIIKKATYQNLVDTWKVGGLAYLGAKEALLFSSQLISASHEFCHAYASCSDEYSYGIESEADSEPEYNCSKISSGSESQICPKWQTDGLTGGCYAKCKYNNWYRSSQTSTMYTGGEPLLYSAPAIKLWQEAFKIP